MGILAYWLQANGLVRVRGWRLVQLSCILFVLWNCCAFMGHWITGNIAADMFTASSSQWNQQLIIGQSPGLAIAFYVLQMDHLLCVPAIVMLFLGIRDFFLRARGKELDGNG